VDVSRQNAQGETEDHTAKNQRNSLLKVPETLCGATQTIFSEVQIMRCAPSPIVKAKGLEHLQEKRCMKISLN
jgi:hypothetical protein